MNRNLLIKLTFAGIAICLVVILVSFFIVPKPKPGGPELTHNPSAEFTLTKDDGSTFHLSDLRGEIVLLFFGYTSCPDACPSTLSKLNRAFNLLTPEEKKQVRTVFVSVDPERDNLQLLRDYLDYFGVNATGVTGTKEEVDKVVKAYQAYYLVIPGESSDWYTINHTTTVYLHDKQGKVRHLLLYDYSPEKVAETIREFL
ncbi:MAG: SCO family protein [Desulfuromonas sp.]|nr:MAG: SCO family protein [Desulfuromonas sp.]